MLEKLNISQKILAMVMGGIITCGVFVGGTSYYSASNEAYSQASKELKTIGELKKDQLKSYLSSIEEDARLLATNSHIISALGEFERAWAELGEHPKETLQNLYITENPNPTGAKEKLDRAQDNSTYSEVHGRYHPWIRSFLEGRGYYDVFIFDKSGNVIFTVFKELDFSSNVMNGEWKDTDLGNVFRSAINAKAGQVFMADFKPYAPSHDVPAGFIATPIVSPAGEILGVLAFQMPIKRIDSIMQNTTGLGKTGETNLIGSDTLLRNNSRFSKEDSILKTALNTDDVKRALKGESGLIEVMGSDGKPMISAYTPFEFLGTKWALVAQEDTEEIMAPVTQLGWTLLLTSLGCIALVIIAVFFGVRKITGVLVELIEKMRSLAKGENNLTVTHQERQDEIGQMAQALEHFRKNAIEVEKLNQQQLEEANKSRETIKKEMLELSEALESEMQSIISTVRSQANHMLDNSRELTSITESVAAESREVLSATNISSGNVENVSHAAQELLSAIQEISSQVNLATSVTADASHAAGETSVAVNELAETAQNISNVINLISEIAEQTNLLALNATIEAARAGDAGKGFAVVASEVKNLATQTAKATETITAEIGNVQHAVKMSVGKIEEIVRKIQQVNEVSSSIAAAVEEQSAATDSISQNTLEASRSTKQAEDKMIKMNEISQTAGDISREVNTLTEDVANQVDELQDRLRSLLRHSSAGDRRINKRFSPGNLRTNMVLSGKSYDLRVFDISQKGISLFMENEADSFRVGTPVDLAITGFNKSIRGNIAGVHEGRLRIVFEADMGLQSEMLEFLEGLRKAA